LAATWPLLALLLVKQLLLLLKVTQPARLAWRGQRTPLLVVLLPSAVTCAPHPQTVVLS
jgi:hypothetical protein